MRLIKTLFLLCVACATVQAQCPKKLKSYDYKWLKRNGFEKEGSFRLDVSQREPGKNLFLATADREMLIIMYAEPGIKDLDGKLFDKLGNLLDSDLEPSDGGVAYLTCTSPSDISLTIKAENQASNSETSSYCVKVWVYSREIALSSDN